MSGFFRRRLVEPVRQLLWAGVTPEKLAWSLAVGLVVGVAPILGATTGLCFLGALVLRLNLPAMQVANYLIYPLQFALFLPFVRAGEWLLGGPRLSLSLAQVRNLLAGDWSEAFRVLATSELKASLIWFLVALPMTPVVARSLRYFLRRWQTAMPASPEP